MNEPGKIWVRSIKFHTYWNLPRDPDTFYQVDTQQDADTLVALKFAVIENPPAKAKRGAASPTNPAQPAQAQAAAAIEPSHAPVVQQTPPGQPTQPVRPAAIMTTADLPKPTRSSGPVIDNTKR